MRKLLLVAAVAAGSLALVPPALAADRYASPTPSVDADIDVCASSAPCSIEDAMNTSKVGVGDSVRLAPGTYTVSSPLSLDAEDAGLRGSGTKAADVVINSSAVGGPALTVGSNSEAERFTLNSSGSGTVGLFIGSGIVDHVAVTSSGGHACSGTNVILVNALCRTNAAGPYSAFQKSSGSGAASFSFINCTFIGTMGWYPMSFEAGGTSLYEVDLFSSIVYAAGNRTIYLNRGSSGLLDFTAENSNYGLARRLVDGSGAVDELPSGTNQSLDPLFTSTSDFTQAPGSPTINAGAVNGRSGDKDLAGNARVIGGVADIGAYESSAIPIVIPPQGDPPAPAPADTTKPTLKIGKKPKSKTTSKKLSATFSANELATFQCKLDKGKFKACKSPYKKTVKLGKHKLQIKATDAAGNVSAVKTVSWTVKKK